MNDSNQSCDTLIFMLPLIVDACMDFLDQVSKHLRPRLTT